MGGLCSHEEDPDACMPDVYTLPTMEQPDFGFGCNTKIDEIRPVPPILRQASQGDVHQPKQVELLISRSTGDLFKRPL